MQQEGSATGKPQRLLWAGRNTENHGGGSTHVFHDVPLSTNMAPIAEVSAGHDHVLILTVNGEVYSFGTAQALLGHSAQPFDLPRRVPELVGKKIVQIAAGLYANAFLTDTGEVWGQHSSSVGLSKIALPQGKKAKLVLEDLNHCYAITEDNEQYVVPAGTFAHKWDVNIVKAYRSSYELGVTENGELHFCTPYYAPEIPSNIIQIGAKGTNALLLCGYPEWTRDTHYLFPEKFKKEVRTLMMMTQRDTNKKPRHPEAHLHLLPLELIDIIIRHLADDAGNRKIYIQNSSGGMELVSLPHNVIPIDVACSYATYLCLTTDGLYTWGGRSFEEHGWSKDVEAPTKLPQLESLPIKRVWAGYYYGLVLVKE